MRAALLEDLAPLAVAAHREVSGTEEELAVKLSPGNGEDFSADLERSRTQEQRVRQTVVGPHRDDLELLVEGKAAGQFASEGQQRTLVLALKIAQARFFTSTNAAPPLLLIDDIFGELDPVRRVSLLSHLPEDSQKLVTATTMPDRGTEADARVFELVDGELHPA